MRQWPGTIIIWSQGGANYAKEMAEKALTPAMLATVSAFEAKWPRLPQSGDVFLDDSPLETFAKMTLDPRTLR